MVLTSRVLISLLAGAGLALAEAPTATLKISVKKPDGSRPIGGDIVGLSIEADRFPDWSGSLAKPNSFVANLMSNYKEKTGVGMHIRVGGGSQDYVHAEPTVTEEKGFYNVFSPVPRGSDLKDTKALFPQAYYTGATEKYYEGVCNFPATTQFTFGVNFKAGNASEALAQIKMVDKAFERCPDVILENIELGNEANGWGGDYRPDGYNVYDYAKEQVDFYTNITRELGNTHKYRLGDASGGWIAKQLLNTDALQTSAMKPWINSLSIHQYSGTGQLDKPSEWPAKAAGLVNKTNVRNRLNNHLDSVTYAEAANLPWVLGETNSFASHGQQGVSNAAAAALWMVDYSLYGASIGIKGIQMHQGVGYNYSAIEPLDNIGPDIETPDPTAKHHTMPQYYGFIVVGEAIGKSGKAFVKEIPLDSSIPMSAFQIFEGDVLKRIVMINSDPWTVVSTGERPTWTVEIPNLGSTATATYKLLEFDSLSVTSGLTWGGQSYETDDGKAAGEKVFHTIGADNLITLKASEIAVINVGTLCRPRPSKLKL